MVDHGVRREIDEALSIAERSADDMTLGFAMFALSAALLHQDSPEIERALELLEQLRAMCVQGRFYSSEIPSIDIWIGVSLDRRGDRDRAIRLVRGAVNDVFDAGQLAYFVAGTGVLAEMLLDRGGSDDLDEVQAAIDRLAAAPLGDEYVLRDLILLRLPALLARAHGDEVGYRDFAARYRKMATDLGFEGHMALAEAMT
ncbi:MAG: hypothetical protein ACRDTN_08750 [Mycobacterium sp.]